MNVSLKIIMIGFLMNNKTYFPTIIMYDITRNDLLKLIHQSMGNVTKNENFTNRGNFQFLYCYLLLAEILN